MTESKSPRPTLVFDGDCAFCTNCARFIERREPEADVVPWQFADLAALGPTEEEAIEAVQWVPAEGPTRSGHEAIAAVLESCGGIWRVIGRALLLPGISWVAARAYRLVARNRYRLPGGTPACRVEPPRG